MPASRVVGRSCSRQFSTKSYQISPNPRFFWAKWLARGAPGPGFARSRQTRIVLCRFPRPSDKILICAPRHTRRVEIHPGPPRAVGRSRSPPTESRLRPTSSRFFSFFPVFSRFVRERSAAGPDHRTKISPKSGYCELANSRGPLAPVGSSLSAHYRLLMDLLWFSREFQKKDSQTRPRQ